MSDSDSNNSDSIPSIMSRLNLRDEAPLINDLNRHDDANDSNHSLIDDLNRDDYSDDSNHTLVIDLNRDDDSNDSNQTLIINLNRDDDESDSNQTLIIDLNRDVDANDSNHSLVNDLNHQSDSNHSIDSASTAPIEQTPRRESMHELNDTLDESQASGSSDDPNLYYPHDINTQGETVRVYYSSKKFEDIPPELEGDINNPNQLWSVESISKMKYINGEKYYLCSWTPTKNKDGVVHYWDNTWEPETGLTQCGDLLEAFNRPRNKRKRVTLTGIGAEGDSDVSSLPYKKARGEFGAIITSIFDEFSSRGEYTVEKGLKHPTNDDLNPKIGFDFLKSVLNRVSVLENPDVFFCHNVIGKNVERKKWLEYLRNAGKYVPFFSGFQAAKLISAQFKKNYKFAVCLIINKKGRYNNGDDFHCAVTVVKNVPREFYYFNPSMKNDLNKTPDLEFIAMKDHLGLNYCIKMGFGTQSNTSDCLERAINFIALVYEGDDWLSESQSGWNEYEKTYT